MKKFFILLTFLMFNFALISTVWAGGGRILIYTADNHKNYYYVGHPVNVLAQVFKESPSTSNFSVGEHVEFRIENPKPGDSCVTGTTITTDMGMTNASCVASTPGQLTIYVHSLDADYDSSRYVLSFYPNPTPTVKPTAIPTKIPTMAPTATLAPQPTLLPTSEPTQALLVSPTLAEQNDEPKNDFIEENPAPEKNNWLLSIILVVIGVETLVIVALILNNKFHFIKNSTPVDLTTKQEKDQK